MKAIKDQLFLNRYKQISEKEFSDIWNTVIDDKSVEEIKYKDIIKDNSNKDNMYLMIKKPYKKHFIPKVYIFTYDDKDRWPIRGKIFSYYKDAEELLLKDSEIFLNDDKTDKYLLSNEYHWLMNQK